MEAVVSTSVCLLLLLVGSGAADDVYKLDDTPGLGRVFDGIGGLSGGGATSRLLVDYPDQQLDDILDLLFKPQFGASLQILKVEIGGDAQSTDGTESSHMHTKDDENYNRGYEWWLMQEAKKRNPDIKLYGLSWAYPAWVGQGKNSPYAYPDVTAGYIVKWIMGAKKYYDLTIDYIGIWNERSYDSNYIKVLRNTLNKNNLTHVQIVAADGSFSKISTEVVNDKDLSDAVAILGAHYPGTDSTSDAVKSNKQLWASEDYSTYNDKVGAGCWARILNQNYVNGNMTSTISWNLIASYYDGLPFFRDGLMTAIEPWSGHYVVDGPVWISAHTTQFTKPGVHYLRHGSGAGHLNGGGSYVTFFDPDSKDFTVVIETMSHDNSKCIRPNLPPYDVAKSQNLTFQLGGKLVPTSHPAMLNYWVSDVANENYFYNMKPVEIMNNQFMVTVPIDTVVTLSTIKDGPQHGNFPDKIPDSAPFPVPYNDTFDAYNVNSEAKYFADQTGVFEIIQETKDNKVMQQVVTERPITWCNDADSPITIIGNFSWQSMETEVMVKLESSNTAVFLAGGVTKGGCGVAGAEGVFAILDSSGQWKITSDLGMKKVLKSGSISVSTNMWYHLSLDIDASSKMVTAVFSDSKVTLPLPSGYSKGAIGFGTGGFYPAQFDNFTITSASSIELHSMY